jgi:hypothetical protein
LDRGRSVARDRHPKARRCFCPSRGGRGRSRAGTWRGGAHLSGCRSAQIDSGASHRHSICLHWALHEVVSRDASQKGATSVLTN